VAGEGSRLRIVVLSGQVGVDEHQALSGDGSFAAQVERAFANLVVALSAGRVSLADVAKLTIYVGAYEPGKIGPIREAVKRHFGDRALPASTLLGVQALARPEFQIEVEALAIKRLDEGA
jgi:enamine deaminase RidA (YjgF/YER057c/UK114 family)